MLIIFWNVFVCVYIVVDVVDWIDVRVWLLSLLGLSTFSHLVNSNNFYALGDHGYLNPMAKVMCKLIYHFCLWHRWFKILYFALDTSCIRYFCLDPFAGVCLPNSNCTQIFRCTSSFQYRAQKWSTRSLCTVILSWIIVNHSAAVHLSCHTTQLILSTSLKLLTASMFCSHAQRNCCNGTDQGVYFNSIS